MSETDGMKHRVDADGILWFTFDRPGEKVNILTPANLQALRHVLAEVRGRTDVRGVVFNSDKPGMFLAGMDVEQIASVQDSHTGAEGARLGQAVFARIAELKVPSVCAINGVCLGGGTELALACSFRIASDDRKVKIGLPEVQLGIIPGFGGTQRMPRLIGLQRSLELILTGRQVDARKARKIGLIDQIVPTSYLEREAVRLLKQASDRGVAATARSMRSKRGMVDRMTEEFGPLRRYVLGQARKRTAAKADPENYPAPHRAIEAIEAAFTHEPEQGFDREARILGELVPTRTSKNLIWLFQSHTALKGADAGLQASPRRVERLAVLGAGIMGGGIAQLAADKGIPVRLRDLQYDAILSALDTAHGLWKRKVKRKRITPRELNEKMAFIAPTLDDSGMTHVDLVIEAVVENLEIKQKVLADLEQRLDERAVFASNTSSLPISDIAARALHPERVVGMHFFNPVHRMPLIEIIAGRRSSPEALSTVHALAIKMGKVPIVVKDGPGFLVNRILTFYMNEALRLFAEGVPIEAVDRAMKDFGMPMGPFALFDQVGLDTAKHVGEVLQAALGKRAGGDGSLLNTMVASGRLGQKNGKGFYLYKNGKPTSPDPEVYAMAGKPAPRDLPPETLQERMVLAMLAEAAVCLEEGVVRQARDIDMGMVMGTGFPPFRGGLLRHADTVGIPIIVDRLSRLTDAQGERFRPARLLQQMVREQRHFYRKT